MAESRRAAQLAVAVASYVALWVADDLLLVAPMVASVFAWGFWPSWVLWMATFTGGSMLLSELVLRATRGNRSGPGRAPRLTRWFMEHAADDPVARWSRRIGGVGAIIAATLALGPPIAIGVVTISSGRPPRRTVALGVSVLYASVWVTGYTAVANSILN